MATKKPSRPFYDVFLERVIRIDAVQRHRPRATDEYASGFFDAGRLLGELDDFRWSLDAPELFSRRGVQILGVINARGFTPSKEKEISPGMRAGSDEAFAAWGAFVSSLRNGEYIATATHPVTGERRDLEPAEWMRTGLVLEVHDGALFAKGRDGKLVELWGAITLRDAAEQPVEPTVELPPVKPVNKLGRVDWDDWWVHEIVRRNANQLPPKKAYLDEAEALIKQRYDVAHVDLSELRRICAALYRGDRERPRRKRRSRKRPQSRSKSQ